MKNTHELVLCIVNSGFSEEVMAVSRTCNASGGTVIHARGTAKEEAEKRFNISIHPEKEIVMILIPKLQADNLLHALYKKVGLSSLAQGIVFSLPVDDIAGLSETK